MSNLPTKKIIAMATDPIYIGTGGYSIGRVDNTIVRDPTTKIPKIPGSSLAGTWRYYMALELISKVKDFQPIFDQIKNKSEPTLTEKIFSYNWENLTNDPKKSDFDKLENWLKFEGNQIAKITCAGQDNVSTAEIDEPNAIGKDGKTGHCGHCIVCKAFGYSKRNQSWQGMLFFSDLNILFFPVYTRLGVRWMSSPKILKEVLNIDVSLSSREKIKTSEGNENTLNLGWVNLEVEEEHGITDEKLRQEIKDKNIKKEDIVIVPNSLISQIINSNLEVRTSVSIDPITGAAKEGALFTSEAIPRGTIFYGEIRLFDRSGFDNNLPSSECVFEVLENTKNYYETLGIGGMTTRGFGRMKILTVLKDGECKAKNNTPKSTNNNGGKQNVK